MRTHLKLEAFFWISKLCLSSERGTCVVLKCMAVYVSTEMMSLYSLWMSVVYNYCGAS